MKSTLRKLRYIFGLVLISSCLVSKAQSLQVEDLLKIYTLDSLSLKQFCTEKKFHLKEKGEDIYLFSYTYQSDSDSKESFLKVYPKDGRQGMVYYYFDSRDQYKYMKKAILLKGFKHVSNKNLFPPGSRYTDYRERYNSDTQTFDISTLNPDETKYAIVLSINLGG